MDRFRKIQLIQRSLGIRHKLKVYESIKEPDTHEELAQMLLAKWDLEDELKAIEEILENERINNIADRKTVIERDSNAGQNLRSSP